MRPHDICILGHYTCVKSIQPIASYCACPKNKNNKHLMLVSACFDEICRKLAMLAASYGCVVQGPVEKSLPFAFQTLRSNDSAEAPRNFWKLASLDSRVDHRRGDRGGAVKYIRTSFCSVQFYCSQVRTSCVEIQNPQLRGASMSMAVS